LRRARLQRRRRLAELARHQEAERARQRRHREKPGVERSSAVDTTSVVNVPVMAVVQALLGRMSRAGLFGDLRVRARRNRVIPGQEMADVTRRPAGDLPQPDAKKPP